ncbi:uncharacterized protein YprB with RNaseH-like and TPR domain [Pedobacter sp. UYP30]|uniref:3'-5' exonuclease n=1 Tax=Pedobacter sp. UYP30 TaxID=1756400 RepID=UPI003394780C
MLDELNLRKIMVIDIETVPQYSAYSEVPENLQSLWEAKTKFQRKPEQTPDEFYERAGILAEFGKIICISMGIFQKEDEVFKLRIKSLYGDNETDLLTSFIALLKKYNTDLTFCAHNGKEFDYPYLCRRMVVNGLNIPRQLSIAGKKPWENPHLDTMELWKFGDYKHYTSLNLLATILNIDTPKDDISGSDVRKVYYEDNDLARIVTYCQKDVITTAQILLKFKGMKTIDKENITIVS